MASDKDQYDNVCKNEFAQIKESLDKFYVAIFEGNGEPAIKTQLKIINTTISGILWLGSIIISGVIIALIQLWIKK